MRWPFIAVAATCIAWLLGASGLGRHLEAVFADARASVLLHEIDSDVVIVAIDAHSLAQLDQWPWPRSYHAQLIDTLARAAPRRLFLDIDFSTRSTPAHDAQLAAALSRWDGPPVLLPGFLQLAQLGDEQLLLSEPLAQLGARASVASVNLQPAADGLVREVRSAWSLDSRTLTAVAYQLAALDGTSSRAIHIDYSIDPASFHYVSYADVLANRVPAQYFADKTILVGATAIELGDTLAVPVHRALPGVVVHALAYESVLRGNHALLPAWLYWLGVGLFAVVLAVLFHRFTWRANTLILAASLVTCAGASVLAYAHMATLLSVVPPGVAAVACYLFSTLKSLEAQTMRALMYAMGFRERDAMLKSIVMSSTDAIICIDDKGIIKTANPAAVALLATTSHRLIGNPVACYLPSIIAADDHAIGSSFATLQNGVAECAATTEAGAAFPAELSISRVKLKDGNHHTLIVRDISERKAQQKQLQYQATHDPLTALPNRSALTAHLDSVLARRGNEVNVALLMVDLNRFKEINDTLGHSVGDYVLFEVAQRFKSISDDHGFIARIGGDEFALVVEYAHREQIVAISEAMASSLQTPIQTSGIGIDLGLSIGIGLYPHDAQNAESLFKYADVAMYVAKRNGGCFEFYDSSNDQHTVRRLEIVSKLRGAISNDEVHLCYQPKINLATGRIDSVEALMRWEDPTLGVVSPAEFVALAEPTDLIQPLSAWTLAKAFAQQRQWLREGLELRVAVNLSTRLLQDAGLPERVAAQMRESGIAARHVEIEITESAMMLDPQRALRVVQDLSALGVHIAIDDFGTGFSSLGYLRDLPVQTLKIDKSFVMNMHNHADDRVIVESTLKMAHAMQLDVVAEGVENAKDVAMLKEFGCDYAQGYFYSPALAADALANFAREFNRACDAGHDQRIAAAHA